MIVQTLMLDAVAEIERLRAEVDEWKEANVQLAGALVSIELDARSLAEAKKIAHSTVRAKTQ